ncbi:MAG: branched-chain amino acid ABC transporter permease [Acidisphaera sp.]|nr:branched-chain amino acid ABC transporter permease [Acidisphaera sp.]MBV9812318.1 branched-chain amino acid ABC transporter permease [Acetobacteraceae bacterium]
MIVPLALNVLALGASYALVALGFVLILNATGAVNFAQGDLVMLGGFVAVVLASHLPLPPLLLLPLLLAAMGAIGVLIAVGAYFPLRDRPAEAVFISTIAVGIILQNAANLLFGPEPQAAPALFGAGAWRWGGMFIDRQSLAVIGVAGLLISALYGVFGYTPLGWRLRAVAQDREMTALLGVPVDRMIAATFAVGAALAGAAGMLLANTFFVTPTEGANYILKAYIAVVVGGWGSLPGAVAGALLIALFEVLYPSLPVVIPSLAHADALFSQNVSTIVLDVVVLLILLLRPQGLFGEASRARP